ncbi:MAG TPA: GIY-YIG nuclease family protein [Thermobifida alba]|nr:GIY-YIG nuclease family protein [Thermobifida alba]
MTEPQSLTEQAQPVELDLSRIRRHEPVVYFVLNGSRIKIGYSTHFPERLRALAIPSESLLLLLRGGTALESALHRRFGKYRVGASEWFEIAPAILRYIGTRLTIPPVPAQGPLTIPEEVSLLSAPASVAGDARAAFGEILREFETRGHLVVQTKDFTPYLGDLGRSRPWVAGELGRLAREGRLTPDGRNRYHIVPADSQA